ncbi:MAG: leucine-rich repeat domain-containing protein [bacterium]
MIEGKGKMPDLPGEGPGGLPFRDSFAGSVKKIVIGEGITEIGTGAFENCRALREVCLPASLYRIRAYAFRNCTSLVKVSAGDRKFVYAYDPFPDTGSQKIIFGADSFLKVPWAEEYFRGFYCSGGTCFICFREGEEIRVPDHVRVISVFSFMNVRARRLVLPESLEVIEKDAFYRACFEEIVMPRGKERLEADHGLFEIRKALGFGEPAPRRSCAGVPSLYGMRCRKSRKWEGFGKLEPCRKKAVVREDGTIKGVWGREVLPLGRLLWNRLKRGGMLIGAVWENGEIAEVVSYIWEKEREAEEVTEFRGRPCPGKGRPEFALVQAAPVTKARFLEMFKDRTGDELTGSKALRTRQDGLPAEWFWKPCRKEDVQVRGKAEEAFLCLMTSIGPGRAGEEKA